MVAFAILGGVLAATGLVPCRETLAASLAIAGAFLPAAWLAPAGFRRRAAELAILPAAFALTLIADPAQRAMALPPLLVLAALAAVAAARPRTAPQALPWLAASFALAVTAAGALGLVGFPLWQAGLALLVPPFLAAAVCRVLGWEAALVVALLTAPLPWVRSPVAAAAILLLGGAAASVWWRWRRRSPRPSTLDGRGLTSLTARVARGWFPGALGVALVASALAPWGLLAPRLAFPDASWLAAGLALAALVLTPCLPPAAAGAAWLAVALALGPPQPSPTERPGLSLSATSPSAQLPPGAGTGYVLDLSLANAGALPAGTLVATLSVGGAEHSLHAGAELSEWALLGPLGHVAHGLPDHPVFRAREPGAASFWSVGSRLRLEVPKEVSPSLVRHPALPDRVIVTVAQAGPPRPTPPRDWPLPAWLLAAALAVAGLQLAARSFDTPSAALPWALLVAGALAARLPLEPLRLLAERHAVDLALAAFLAAWLPLARRFLPARPFLTATALLLPLALATPHLTPPMGDGNYHLLLMQSLVRDGDFDLANNFDLEHYPNQRIYLPFPGVFLHSPVLAVLLAPGFALAGRSGALALLALTGAGLVALLARRAEQLGVPRGRTGWLSLALLLSYPLLTFTGELWTELPGAFLLALSVGLVALPRVGPWAAPLLAVLGSGLKTRFALPLGPQVLAAWWPQRLRPRTVLLALAAAGVTAGFVAIVLTALLGNPLDPLGRRSLTTLLRVRPAQAGLVVGGLALDSAGGLLWAAPLALAATLGLGVLARRSGAGERALLAGAALTVAALLHLQEWRGGDSPPARYLVPLLPVAALAGAMLLRLPRRWRPLLWVLVPPTLAVSWVAATRPFLLINTGNGGFWLGNVIARRTGADALDLFPSFLRLTTATWAVPTAVLVLVALVATVTRLRPGAARLLRRAGVSVWILAGGALLVTLMVRPDAAIEVEDPQVRHIGGVLDPPPGTFLRYLLPNGWRLATGEAVEVPISARAGDEVHVTSRVEGPAGPATMLLASWIGYSASPVAITVPTSGVIPLPPSPAGGHHLLRLALQAPPGVSVVLDRVDLGRPR